MKADKMLILTNMLEKIISEMDDLKGMLKEATQNNFEENFEEGE
tara:strand:+ start:338 stop:469 length:132 start_codon:yes stop_codon:yes gene_type:complete